MPTHFAFSFGVGDWFNFKFDYGRRREVSPGRCDHRSVITDWDMAKVGSFVSFKHRLVAQKCPEEWCEDRPSRKTSHPKTSNRMPALLGNTYRDQAHDIPLSFDDPRADRESPQTSG